MSVRISNYRDCIISCLFRRRATDGADGTLFSTIIEEVQLSEGSELSSVQRKRLLDTCGKLIVEDIVQMIGKGRERKFLYIPFHQRRGAITSTSADEAMEPTEGPPEKESDMELPDFISPGGIYHGFVSNANETAHNPNGHSDSENYFSTNSESDSETDSETETEICEACGASRIVSSISIEPLL